jgi:hypothetical protein
MNPGPVDRADEIFLALADLSTAERESFLQERCGGDTRLRDEVDAMLAALDSPDPDFLDPRTIPSLDMNAVDGPLQPGTALGPFRVLHAIGSGGMGVVYAAQQDRPRRTVAIKVLRRGFRHPEIIKRFAREAEVLARLRHPGIAQVFAFHPGDRQAPAHLVMEMVSGPSITEYAQANGLSIAARAELSSRWCDAVQHAHDRGVIHRSRRRTCSSAKTGVRGFSTSASRATGLDIQSSIRTAHGQILDAGIYEPGEAARGAAAEVDPRSELARSACCCSA